MKDLGSDWSHSCLHRSWRDSVSISYRKIGQNTYDRASGVNAARSEQRAGERRSIASCHKQRRNAQHPKDIRSGLRATFRVFSDRQHASSKCSLFKKKASLLIIFWAFKDFMVIVESFSACRGACKSRTDCTGIAPTKWLSYSAW